MTPTNKLRWFLRAAYAPPVLQQWWENEPTTYEDIGVTGEWRDVPIEEQA